MVHKMKLHNNPFQCIKNKSKTIEIRLNDEKRRLLNIKDDIEFVNIDTNETLRVNIVNLYPFKNFKELYNSFDKMSLGYKEKEKASYEDMYEYYSKEQEDKYGVLAIEIKKYARKDECIDNTINILRDVLGDEYLKEFGLDEESCSKTKNKK